MTLVRITILLLTALMGTHVVATEILDGLLERLEDDSFAVREKATKDLVAHDISIDEVQRLLKETKLPETRQRLAEVINGKLKVAGWIEFTSRKDLDGAVPCGKEANGGKLYLVKINRQGGDLIGKYLTDWGKGANFAVGDKEMLLEGFSVWIGEGQWKPWKKGMKNMSPMLKIKYLR